jgi:hypothetical protein
MQPGVRSRSGSSNPAFYNRLLSQLHRLLIDHTSPWRLRYGALLLNTTLAISAGVLRLVRLDALACFCMPLGFTATLLARFDFYVCGYEMFYNVIFWVLIT